jgi:hypothetical protein
VTVVDEGMGTMAPGTAAIYYWDHFFAAWRPSAPLRPNARHRVDVTLTNDAPRPAGANGADQLTFFFTTSDQRVPSLTLQGAMEVRVEQYEREDWSRCTPQTSCAASSCGCGCTSTNAREVGTRARVTVPKISGGLVDPGYLALVRVTADTPYVFPHGEETDLSAVLGTGSETGLRADTPAELVFDLDGQKALYKPCFALRVSDLAGNESTVDPICVDMTVETPRKLPLTSSGPPTGGCRVSGRADETVVGLLVVLAGVLVRRRRPALARETIR